MTKGIQRLQPVLTLCLLLSITQAAFGQHSQIQQSSHVSRQTLERNSAMRLQQRGASHPISSTVRQKQSNSAVHAQSLLPSQRQRHVAQSSVHVRPIPVINAGERSGTHDFNHGMGMQMQDPSAGRAGAFHGIQAMGPQSHRSGQQARQHLADQSASAGRDHPDLQAGRGGHRSGQQQATGSSDGRARPDTNSQSGTRQRRNP